MTRKLINIALLGAIVLLFTSGCTSTIPPNIYISKPEKNVVLKAKVGDVIYENSYLAMGASRVRLTENATAQSEIGKITVPKAECDLRTYSNSGTCFIPFDTKIGWFENGAGYLFIDKNSSGYFTELKIIYPDRNFNAKLDKPVKYRVVDTFPHWRIHYREYLLRITYTGIKKKDKHMYATFKEDMIHWDCDGHKDGYSSTESDGMGKTLETALNYRRKEISAIGYRKDTTICNSNELRRLKNDERISVSDVHIMLLDGTNENEIEYIITENLKQK